MNRYMRIVKTEKSETDAETFLFRHGFKMCPSGYRKGLGFFGPPSFISVEITEGKAEITAWRKHAILPGVFALDVHRRGRRLERMADSLAAYLTCNDEAENPKHTDKFAAISLICGILSLAAWLIPVAGMIVSASGIIASVMCGSGKGKKAVLGQALSIFGLMAALMRFILNVCASTIYLK